MSAHATKERRARMLMTPPRLLKQISLPAKVRSDGESDVFGIQTAQPGDLGQAGDGKSVPA